MIGFFRAAVLAAALSSTACGGSETAPTPAKPMAANAGDAVQTSGDATLRANALQTSALNETVAQRYGIERDDKTVMLLVGLRKGEGANETSLPARVTVRIAGLGGGAREIEMRELRTGDLIDYIGTTRISLPETLRFEIDAVFENNQTVKAQFSRDFYPR